MIWCVIGLHSDYETSSHKQSDLFTKLHRTVDVPSSPWMDLFQLVISVILNSLRV